jgi:2-phosphoglycerate kinase
VQWKETCQVLERGIESVVLDALNRGISLVLEGVHVIPGDMLVNKWKEAGGIAVGVVLCIPDPETHRKVIFKRGETTAKGADAQLKKFNRIRSIHDEMIRLGKENNWLLIEQKPILEPKPLDLLNDKLKKVWIEGNSPRNLLQFGEQHYW